MNARARTRADMAWGPLQGMLGVLAIVMLVGVLVVLRMLETARMPDQTIRVMEVMAERALPPPPPPPPEIPDEPPPPQRVELPRLQPHLDPSAPAIKARLDPNLDLTMEMAMFELEVDPPPVTRPQPKPQPRTVSKPAPKPVVKTTYSSGELDSRPRLRYAPSVSFPSNLLKQGIREGRVTVEVTISTSGRVSVRRILSSSHSQFSSLARTAAAGARFTTPTKNGRPVQAIYRWPLVFRP